MTQHLIKGGKHQVTGIVRANSASEIPPGIHSVHRVNYDDKVALTTALKGQDAVVITLSPAAPNVETSCLIIDAALAAGVPWVIPNEYGYDFSNQSAAEDTRMRDRVIPVREYIEKVGKGKLHWIGVCCGFWYEHSLTSSEYHFGFDFKNQKVTFVDDGKNKINVSTWAQVGRAAAALLSLKILPEDANDKSTCLSQYANGQIHVSSFLVSQRDIFESVLRVTGDDDSDWTISYDDSTERFRRGAQMLEEGNMFGWVIILYTRMLDKRGDGNYNDKLDNQDLGLVASEELDEITKATIDVVSSNPSQR